MDDFYRMNWFLRIRPSHQSVDRLSPTISSVQRSAFREHTLVAAGHISSVTINIHCLICGLIASILEAAVCSMKPFLGSRKIWYAAAWRTILRTISSLNPDVEANCAKVTSLDSSGTLVANP